MTDKCVVAGRVLAFAGIALLGGWSVTAETADRVFDVASGHVEELPAPLDTDQRIVKTGAGTLVLPAGNSFRGGVLVSEGTLCADYEASGLKSTHLTIDGASYLSPAYLQVVGSSFTAPVAASGEGTVTLNRYAGIVPYDRPLTIDFGGDGRKLVVGEDGFTPTDLILNNSTACSARLVNPIDQKGMDNLTLKSGAAPLYVHHFTNSVNQGELNFWGGSLVFDGGSFFRTRRASWRDGTVLFTNATIRMYNDFSVGGSDSNSGVAKVTLKDCDKKTSWGTDHVNGNAGTVLTIDGGTYLNVGGMRIGEVAGKTGTLVLTNDVRYTCTDGNGTGFYIGNGGRIVQTGGTVELNSDNAQIVVSDGVYEMTGGELTTTKAWMNDFEIGSANDRALAGTFLMKGGRVSLGSSVSVQVGSHGTGTFLMTGGEVDVGGYFVPGRYKTGIGSLLVHGGRFTHRIATGGSFNVGEEGSGCVSVANGGVLDVADNDGVALASSWSSGAKGSVLLSPGGVLKAKRIKGSDNETSFVFNGGTFEVNGYSGASINNTNSIINTYVTRAAVTSLGGAVDNGDLPTIRLARPLVAATADEASEALAHRWKFDGNSLADCVGTSAATVGGAVEWTSRAVRLLGTAQGTSYVKLGTGLLPTDGRGVTIETTLTLNRHTNWARIFDFGAVGADFYWTYNRGGSSSTFISIKGLPSTWTGTYRLAEGRRYHFALVLDRQHDGTWQVNAYIHDPATGELLEAARLVAPKAFSLAPFASADCRLGCSCAATDDDPAADYEDVRLYNRAMTEEQVRASATEGADRRYYFAKKGGGSLTMSGANAYAVGTQVAEGVLRLADGATLPPTELRVDAGATLELNATAQQASRLEGLGTLKGGSLTVNGPILPGGEGVTGRLTLEGTALTGGVGGRLVVDVASGACDCLSVTADLDLSSLELEVSLDGPTSRSDHVIVRAASVSGEFKSVKLPRGWTLSYGTTDVKLRKKGFCLLFR